MLHAVNAGHPAGPFALEHVLLEEALASPGLDDCLAGGFFQLFVGGNLLQLVFFPLDQPDCRQRSFRLGDATAFHDVPSFAANQIHENSSQRIRQVGQVDAL